LFEPESTDVYGELVGNTIVRPAFLQMITEGGQDGVNFNVAATESVDCVKIAFRTRSKAGDTANFDITVGGVTQSFEYISTSDTNDEIFEFNTPITFTETTQSLEFLLTGLTNSDASTTPRFRIYDVTFHLDLSSLGVDDVEDNLQDLKVFPNPAKGVFSLSKDVESGILYNLYGSKSLEFKGQSQNIDISSLKPGLYFLQVRDNNGSKKTLKLLKK
jgi:hypothetical protein